MLCSSMLLPLLISVLLFVVVLTAVAHYLLHCINSSCWCTYTHHCMRTLQSSANECSLPRYILSVSMCMLVCMYEYTQNSVCMHAVPSTVSALCLKARTSNTMMMCTAVAHYNYAQLRRYVCTNSIYIHTCSYVFIHCCTTAAANAGLHGA
jgi:hypothetical protein